MYPELMVIPMREELVRAGIKETRTAEEVDAALAEPGREIFRREALVAGRVGGVETDQVGQRVQSLLLNRLPGEPGRGFRIHSLIVP